MNPKQTEILYSTAIDFMGLGGDETVIDAYCGTGTIGIIAANHAGSVIGVELNSDAVRDAKENAKLNSADNVSFYAADAGRFMVDMARSGKSVDVVVMDPPRTGSDRNFIESVLTTAPKKIVYVSCNPETLARDLQYFVKGGYRVRRAVPVDMFPHTKLRLNRRDFLQSQYQSFAAGAVRMSGSHLSCTGGRCLSCSRALRSITRRRVSLRSSTSSGGAS